MCKEADCFSRRVGTRVLYHTRMYVYTRRISVSSCRAGSRCGPHNHVSTSASKSNCGPGIANTFPKPNPSPRDSLNDERAKGKKVRVSEDDDISPRSACRLGEPDVSRCFAKPFRRGPVALGAFGCVRARLKKRCGPRVWAPTSGCHAGAVSVQGARQNA